MRKTNSYYVTEYVSSHTWRVQKMTPDLDLDGRPYTLNQIEGGAILCNCVARIGECRHVKILKKFHDQIGKHPPYDFDNDRFFEVAGGLTDV